MSVAVVARRPPPMGRKQVFLPNFTLTLLRTPELPPTFASFIVPLNLNKLDIRDYLFNAYGVRIRGVRSFIQQQKVRQDKPGTKYPSPRKWYRPRSIKKMMVELERPFVWPEVPEDLEQWDKTTFDAMQKENEEYSEEVVGPNVKERANMKQRKSIAEQAQALLKGEDEWKPTKMVWEDFGAAKEVETDVSLPNQA